LSTGFVELIVAEIHWFRIASDQIGIFTTVVDAGLAVFPLHVNLVEADLSLIINFGCKIIMVCPKYGLQGS
jgi:hypothetical protein